jgi:hypothetical protein
MHKSSAGDARALRASNLSLIRQLHFTTSDRSDSYTTRGDSKYVVKASGFYKSTQCQLCKRPLSQGEIDSF